MNSDTSDSFSSSTHPLGSIYGYFQGQSPLSMLPHCSQAAAAAVAAAATAWTSGTSPGGPAVSSTGLSLPASEEGTLEPKRHSQYFGSSGSDHSGAPDSEPGLSVDSSIIRREVRLSESGRKSYACTLCDFATKQKGLLKV